MSEIGPQNISVASRTTLNTKGPVAASCRRSQLIESCLKALIANRLTAKKHFGSTLKCCRILYIILDFGYYFLRSVSAPVPLFNDSAVDYITWVGDNSVLATIDGNIYYMVI